MRVQLISVALAGVLALAVGAAAQDSPWERPAAELARRIADVLGPSSAHISWANLSGMPDVTVPVIRRVVESDLAADGVSPAGTDSANSVRITLSQDSRGGLWVAEIQQGPEVRVVMVSVDMAPAAQPAITQKIALKRRSIVKASELKWKTSSAGESSSPQILGADQAGGRLILLTPARIAVFEQSAGGWTEVDGAELGVARAATRDPRGIVIASAQGFAAWAPGVACTGVTPQTGAADGGWSIQCHPSDDPWPLAQTAPDTWLKGFYNGARDYFTGVVTPQSAADLPPFYTASALPGRLSGAALLVGGIDGKISVAEGNELKPVAGTRDWGSDFAVLTAGCGTRAEVIVSSSGEAPGDSLRAFEIAGQEAAPVSESLELGGTAMALQAASDSKSAMAILRLPLENGRGFEYEVDRVTAACD